jgi:2-amino-4-hydroxy-6-hydroxymethyldihydropteridine diphosphokinase
MPWAYVGIGSNIDPLRHVRAGVRALVERFGALRISPVFASAPVGFEGPEFLNLVVGFETAEPPDAVAAALDEIERRHGRTADSLRFTPRALDLDLLLYDDLVLSSPSLTVPREDISRYAFVLRPLAELVPDGRHPVSGERFIDMWQAFPVHTQPLRRVEMALP